MLSPHDVLTTLGGLARGTTLQGVGVTRQRLSHAVRRGEIERVRPGVFATTSLQGQVREAALHGGALTCAAALRTHGIWVFDDDDRPHVWIGRRGRAFDHSGCRCVSHYFRGNVPLGVVDVETALVQVHRCLGDEVFFAALESALNLRRLSKAAVQRIRRSLPRYARWLVDLARTDAQSGLESLLRLRLHLLGFTLACQVAIHGVGRVDFVIGDRLIIEVDGRENHTGAANRHRDLMRDASASAAGYETLRFSYAQIVHGWPAVQAAIMGAAVRVHEHS
ncbi:type IV toxin-antitoxin system AbiEi family antitoxin domain-containing protein [Microbacterium hydrocarbonoxydans]|uniref:type IV toxin-antitoxin system AbiEi family antitoxin domain-containing protein n=1 Tax=Microbacterium hydrocarbonoxydans TaxID=273678 RepID=UPI00204137DB|nr:type IV toxin-antitoxin system AbiEi family antitoxin domain-containing protein [Microbacterium hydrocarbonoxydans]MCM3779431.1 DUF559 domain-containing protein [Microbacterium hydrocarbonoxydans]